MMNDKELIGMILDTYKNQLKYGQLEKHIILCGTDMIWDYNFDSHQVRPFNSVLWYDMSLDIYKDFLFYIDDIIHKIINNYEFDNDTYPFITIDKSIKINLHTLAFDLLVHSSMPEIRSFNQFFSSIRKLYIFNDFMIHKTLENQKDLLETLGALS